MKWLFCIFLGLLTNYTPTMNIPQTEISNSLIKAKIYLPDTEKGYYRGTRFDWSGNMPELVFNGHSYFGEWYTWYTKYSPEIHDVIMGPVEEFTALDYAETQAGDTLEWVYLLNLMISLTSSAGFTRLLIMVNGV
jgi:hypothetical protein